MKSVIVVLTLVVLAGCSAAAPSPEPTLPAALAARTPWQTELTNLEPDGTRSLESALTLFAMAFGPIPGVQVETADEPVGSASPAVRAIAAQRDNLTDEQRTAIDGYMTAAEDGSEVGVPTASSGMTAAPSVGPGPVSHHDRRAARRSVRARPARDREAGAHPRCLLLR